MIAENASNSIREVRQQEFGTKEMDVVRIIAQVNGSTAALDVIWKDLTILAEQLPGRTLPTLPRRQFAWWIPVVALGGVLALVAGVWRGDFPARQLKAGLPWAESLKGAQAVLRRPSSLVRPRRGRQPAG